MVPAGSTPTLAERYRTLYPLGRGGMGSVELALERKHDGGAGYERIVALKRLLPEAKSKHAEMFLREARLAVLLQHPNVVHAYDSGEVGGELFMAMEYVEGEPLSRVLDSLRTAKEPLDWRIVAHVIAAVADGLHAAHELVDEAGAALKVVHRDVSPHNVMVAYDGEVKLLDFGVAKIEAEHGLTRTGEVKGKAAYMSPEQAMGDPLDRRSDLYSLGAVLFECLAGRRMWEGTDMEVMRKLALDAPPKLEGFAPSAPPALARLYERMVARDRADRPASAQAIATELRALAGNADEALDALGVLMTKLFGDAARARRVELDRALTSVDEPEVEDLRKSLDPGHIVRTASRSAPRIQAEPKRSRGLLFAAALVVVALAALAAMKLREPTASAEAPNATPTPTSTSTSTSAGAEAPAGSGALAPSTATSTSTSTSTSTATSTSPSPPALSAKPRPPRVDPKPAPKPAPSVKPLDVDPHAI